MKRSAEELKKNLPNSYEDLVATLKAFAEQRATEIEMFYEYVHWLAVRNVMAPVILFTYRVWGSTQMGDRWIDTPAESGEGPDQNLIRTCVELVLGLRNSRILIYDKIGSEIEYEIFDSMDPEELSGCGAIDVPENRVIARTARRVYEECATYFREIRDSLRNVIIDLEKFEEQRNLIQSDSFWREFIAKAILTKKTETQLWDFKETLTMWHATEQAAKNEAKVAFAEDVASLANGRGGVLVIGVTDRAREIIGLSGSPREVENRLKVAREVIASHVVYDSDISLFRQVVLRVKGEERLCLVIVVAQARGTVGVRDSQERYTYPVRRETGIERVSSWDVTRHRLHLKADNYDFISELNQFVREN